jgi:hypothetical protein
MGFCGEMRKHFDKYLQAISYEQDKNTKLTIGTCRASLSIFFSATANYKPRQCNIPVLSQKWFRARTITQISVSDVSANPQMANENFCILPRLQCGSQ